MVGWHDTPWMWVSMIVFWSGFVVLAFYVVKAMSNAAAAPSGPQASEILAQRYARGEMSAEEYREQRETLESTRTPGS